MRHILILIFKQFYLGIINYIRFFAILLYIQSQENIWKVVVISIETTLIKRVFMVKNTNKRGSTKFFQGPEGAWAPTGHLVAESLYVASIFSIGLKSLRLLDDQVYAARLDDPYSRTFERCSTDTYTLYGPCTYQICYLYLYRSGYDGWKPETVTVYGYYTKSVTFYYNTWIPNGIWYGFDECHHGASASAWIM